MQVELTKARLDAAVASGILTAEQAWRLTEFLAATGAPTLSPSEEGIEVARGFHDIFLTIGTVLLLSGAWVLGTAWVALPVSWVLAEVLHRRKGTRLPMIALSLSFTGAVVMLGALLLNEVNPFSGNLHNLTAIKLTALGLGAGLLFLLRFRTPFSAYPVAFCATGLVLAIAGNVVPPAQFDRVLIPLLLACGVVIFAVAIALDMRDRLRETWVAATAFWLHLAAAPLIVHALMWQAYINLTPGSDGAAYLALAIVALLAVVALIIDRRSLMVSTLAYLIAAIAYLVGTRSAATTFPVTFILVGAAILGMGLAWRPLRGAMLGLMPQSVVDRLSPL